MKKPPDESVFGMDALRDAEARAVQEWIYDTGWEEWTRLQAVLVAVIDPTPEGVH